MPVAGAAVVATMAAVDIEVADITAAMAVATMVVTVEVTMVAMVGATTAGQSG
jgi:hypothetical protein